MNSISPAGQWQATIAGPDGGTPYILAIDALNPDGTFSGSLTEGRASGATTVLGTPIPVSGSYDTGSGLLRFSTGPGLRFGRSFTGLLFSLPTQLPIQAPADAAAMIVGTFLGPSRIIRVPGKFPSFQMISESGVWWASPLDPQSWE